MGERNYGVLNPMDERVKYKWIDCDGELRRKRRDEVYRYMMTKISHLDQPALFDRGRERAEKDAGMALAAARNAELLEIFRAAAELVWLREGTADIERVRAVVVAHDVDFEPGNWMGAVFKGNGWRPTGEFVQASHKGSHARMVRVWTK